MASCTVGLADWTGIIGLSVFLSILVISIIYMVGKALRSPTVEAWTKIELYQAAATIIFVAGASLLITTACSVDLSFFDYYLTLTPPDGWPIDPTGAQDFTSSTDFFEAAHTYLISLQEKVYGYFSDVKSILMNWERRASRSEYNCPASCLILPHGWSIDPGMGFYAKMGAGYFALNALVVSMLSLSSLLYMLEYASSGALLWLFPIGAFFRAIPYMRGFGGALMALALVLFLGLPFILFVNALLAYGALSATIMVPESCIADGGGSCIPSMAVMAATASFTTVFLPILDFIILAAFGRDLANLFGSELDLTRLSQLV